MKNTTKGYKVKDFVFLGIVTAIYFILYGVIGFLTRLLGPLGHAFTPAIYSLAGGTIILFVVYKVPKLGVLTIMTLVFQALFTAIGHAYLPMFICSLLGAIIADIIAFSGRYERTMPNALAYASMQVGTVLGGIIPAIFFTQNFIDRFSHTRKGVKSTEEINAMLHANTGWIAVLVIVLTALFAILGVLIGAKILSKHFKNR